VNHVGLYLADTMTALWQGSRPGADKDKDFRDHVTKSACRPARVVLDRRLVDGNRIAVPRKIDIRIVETPHGRRLEPLREHLQGGRVCAHEREVSFIANRQRYEFSLWAIDEKHWPEADAAFKDMLDSARFTPPDTGAVLVDKARNRWVHRAHHLAIDLPEGWAPVVDSAEGALFYASGPAHGAVWPHNYLKVSRTHREARH
jgi:hypothetical protein